MAVRYDEKLRIFTLETKNSTYQMKADPYGFLLHLYYGRRTSGNMDHLLTYYNRAFAPNPWDAGNDRTYSLDVLPQEYPVWGGGDYRPVCLKVRQADGSYGCDLRFESYEVEAGKYSLPGLPAVYADAEEAQTLKIHLRDKKSGMRVTLLYGVLPELDAITRAVEITGGDRTVELLRVLSACIDLVAGEYDWISFYGAHARERMVQRTGVIHGLQSVGSRRGTSSHQYNPFLILARPETTEEWGGCYGMSFVYSGGFLGEVEKDQFDQTRVLIGLSDDSFCYELRPGEHFLAPETVMIYSGEGLGELSRRYHRLYRRHLCRGRYRTAPRPVLLNSWEATYFDFTGEKIVEIAKQAKELGIEMLVLDDGWFGKRESDCSGLGDWKVNERKLGGSLASLVERINALGLKFGLWMEPEMVSEDSDLYRKHPDWVLRVPGRDPVRGRCQLVLDLSRQEVVDAIYGQISAVLRSANIEYIKWDMNRSICDAYSLTLEKERQGEVLYRYMLGLYDLLERIHVDFPDILMEGCSGGGGRFDAGMLYYAPQIWCSDNTDAIDRIRIQYGTSFGYPVSAIGSHVSASPNHQTGRVTPMRTRGVVAMSGSFGYELDLGRLTEEEKECVREQIAAFRRYRGLIHEGDLYRLTDPQKRQDIAAWQFVSPDKTETLLNAVKLTAHGNPPVSYVRAAGLDPKRTYVDPESGRRYCGAGLMEMGIPLPKEHGEYLSYQIYLKAVEGGEGKET